MTATYTGGASLSGHLIGLVDVDGRIEMSYHHVTTSLELQSGGCRSTPEALPAVVWRRILWEERR